MYVISRPFIELLLTVPVATESTHGGDQEAR